MSRPTPKELRAARVSESWAFLDAQVPEMVGFALRQVKHQPQDYADLRQAGMLAGIEAIRKWAPEKYPFTLYVVMRVRYALRTWLRANCSVVPVGWRLSPQPDLSLNTPIPFQKEGELIEFLDLLDYDEAGPEGYRELFAEVERRAAPEAAEALLGLADEPERGVLRALYGVGRVPLTHAKIGAQAGMTGSWARDNAARAKEKIRRRVSQSERQRVTRRMNVASGREPLRFDARQDCQHVPAERHPGFWYGAARVLGHGATWRESTGRVFNDWSWKPTEEDIRRGSKR